MEWSVRAIMRTLVPVLLALTLVEVGSGLVLGAFESTLLRYPSLLVLVPVVIGTAGNLGSVLAARLSTAFHLGLLEFSRSSDRLTGNAIATVLLAGSIFPVVGAGAWLLGAATGGARLHVATTVAVATLSGLVLAVLAVVVAVVATYAAYLTGANPDDVVIPVVTNACDVLGVVVLFLVVAALV